MIIIVNNDLAINTDLVKSWKVVKDIWSSKTDNSLYLYSLVANFGSNSQESVEDSYDEYVCCLKMYKYLYLIEYSSSKVIELDRSTNKWFDDLYSNFLSEKKLLDCNESALVDKYKLKIKRHIKEVFGNN